MCLITYLNQEPVKAETDITVYKALYKSGKTLHAPFHNDFQYELGKTYLDKMELSDEDKYFDNDDRRCIERKLGFGWTVGDGCKSIGRGFHSALTKNRVAYIMSANCVVKCTIPAGTLYYTGVSEELVVSEAIRIDEMVYPYN